MNWPSLDLHFRHSLACAAAAAGFLALPFLARSFDLGTLEGKPVIGRNVNGQLEVFKVDAKGELRHRWQKASDGDWSAWSRLSGGCLPGIAVTTNRAGE